MKNKRQVKNIKKRKKIVELRNQKFDDQKTAVRDIIFPYTGSTADAVLNPVCCLWFLRSWFLVACVSATCFPVSRCLLVMVSLFLVSGSWLPVSLFPCFWFPGCLCLCFPVSGSWLPVSLLPCVWFLISWVWVHAFCVDAVLAVQRSSGHLIRLRL